MRTKPTEVALLRQKAERFLRATGGGQSDTSEEIDPRRLVHELQVYQVELEMQLDETRKVQQDLEHSRDRYTELYESIPAGYFTLDRIGTILNVNPAAAAMLKSWATDLVGKRLLLFIPSARRKDFVDFLGQVLQNKSQQTFEVELCHDFSGEVNVQEDHRPVVLVSAAPCRSDGKLIRAAMIDITGRKAAERKLARQEEELRASRQTLQEMNTKVLNIQDEERRTIARELHDDCCQQLAMLMMAASAIERMTTEPVAKKLRTMRDQIKQVLDTVRHIAYGLHPAMWESTGIEEAMRNYLTNFMEVTELHVQFDAIHVPERVPQAVASCLLRTLQEALHNIVKYAQASLVEVQLIRKGESISLFITDDGRGFDPEKASSRGLGFTSLGERVRLLNGSMDISSRPAKGTTIHVSVPLLNFNQARA
ncbi:MAG TPA: PAS domain-containing sensor histidine kinase [Nitrospiraceae bacterium]|nr:PAS domain-containing sensor histidine kinase [Nitrospiraceae bacterium]